MRKQLYTIIFVIIIFFIQNDNLTINNFLRAEKHMLYIIQSITTHPTCNIVKLSYSLNTFLLRIFR